MLKALLQQKVRHTSKEIVVGQRWLDLFRSSEDFLTSTFFERVSYLPPSTLIRLLEIASTRSLQLSSPCRQVENFVFWPKWYVTNISERRYVEPDVFIRLSLIDESKFDLIVESKFHSHHNIDQMHDQLIAYFEQTKLTGPSRAIAVVIVGDYAPRADFVADVASLIEKIQPLAGDSKKVFAIYATWNRLREASLEIYKSSVDTSEGRILLDAINGFEAFGLKSRDYIIKLSPSAPDNLLIDECSIGAFAHWHHSLLESSAEQVLEAT